MSDVPGGESGTDRPLVVALDGPAGSGKSTVAAAVARRLSLPHVDTGAFYRAATLAVMRAGLLPSDGGASADRVEQIVTVVRALDMVRVEGRMQLDDEDVEEEIRGQAVTAAVSAVARLQPVRDALLSVQQDGLARRGGVIEGRDAATRVAPDAQVKVWLNADVQERARRRAEQAGQPERLDFHVADLRRRDAADARQMVRHPDAVVVDTTGLSLQQVVDTVAGLA